MTPKRPYLTKQRIQGLRSILRWSSVSKAEPCYLLKKDRENFQNALEWIKQVIKREGVDKHV